MRPTLAASMKGWVGPGKLVRAWPGPLSASPAPKRAGEEMRKQELDGRRMVHPAGGDGLPVGPKAALAAVGWQKSAGGPDGYSLP